MTVLEGSPAAYISVLWVVRAAKSAQIGAFIIQALELFNHITEEIDYLWRTPFRAVTCLYALARYFPFCVQIVNLALSEIIHASPSPTLCVYTFTAKIISAQLLSTCIETILMIRVYALYNRTRRTGLFLLAIMISGTSLELTAAVLCVSKLRPGPRGTICNTKESPIEALVAFVIGGGLIHGTILVMTISKVAIHRKTGWMRTPLVAVLLRDGVFVFLVLSAVLAAFITVETAHGDSVLWWNVVYSWYVALLSIVGCRLVLNMRKLAVQRPLNEQNSSPADSIQLTSFFEDQSISVPIDSTVSSI
ncbi:hypothetical protein BJ912DRAFT_964215 [Pholiota molesta]|nr:hypothetical protein BJ912DRAFT_964215 [Pholiota molesta]